MPCPFSLQGVSVDFIQSELSTIMTIAALLLGFSMAFGGSEDRDSLEAANKEDKKFYGKLIVNYQGAFMSTTWIATIFCATALFCSVTTYMALRAIKPQSISEATLFYRLFENEMNVMYGALYVAGIFLCICAFYGWTIKTRVTDDSNLHYFYMGA